MEKMHRGKAHARYKNYSQIKGAIAALKYKVIEDFKEDMNVDFKKLHQMLDNIVDGYHQNFKTFPICNHCNKEVYGRKIRKDIKFSKIQTWSRTECSVCKRKTTNSNVWTAKTTLSDETLCVVVMKRHPKTLKETMDYIEEHKPELLV